MVEVVEVGEVREHGPDSVKAASASVDPPSLVGDLIMRSGYEGGQL
jgi:hypothetical protein